MKRKTTPFKSSMFNFAALRMVHAKSVHFKLVAMIALLGVYSVSSETFAYPVSRYSSTPSDTSSTNKPAPKPRKEYRSESSVTTLPMAPGSSNLSLGVGQVFLLGELGNASPVTHTYENALGLQATYNYGVSDLFAFQSDFGYSSHTNGDLSLLHLSAGLRSNLVYFDRLVPYFNLGLGFYRPSLTYVNRSTASATLFGLQLGAGIDLFLSDHLFFGSSLTYHNMFTSTKFGSDGVSRDIGGAFVSFLIHIGFTF